MAFVKQRVNEPARPRAGMRLRTLRGCRNSPRGAYLAHCDGVGAVHGRHEATRPPLERGRIVPVQAKFVAAHHQAVLLVGAGRNSGDAAPLCPGVDPMLLIRPNRQPRAGDGADGQNDEPPVGAKADDQQDADKLGEYPHGA